jgi:sorbitol-specific phosphotransferase system component IIA
MVIATDGNMKISEFKHITKRLHGANKANENGTLASYPPYIPSDAAQRAKLNEIYLQTYGSSYITVAPQLSHTTKM